MNKEMKKVEEFFASGDIESAKYMLLSMNESEPNNAEVLNNLAVIFFQEGRKERALEYIRNSLNVNPYDREAILNYADILAAMGQLVRARGTFEVYLEKHPDDLEVQEFLKRVGGEKRTSKPRLAIICIQGLDSFLDNVELALQEHFEVIRCVTVNGNEMIKAVKDSDVVWLEWANESAVDLTRTKDILDGKHVICRLHSYEAFAPYMQQIDWTKINDLIFVGESLKRITLSYYPNIEKEVQKVYVVPTGIDLNKYKFRKRDKGKNLAFLGSVNYKKGPMLLFHAFAELAKTDPSYKLFIAGDIQDMRYSLYFKQLANDIGISNNIQFDGKIDNVDKWLEDKSYIVCSSVLESQCLAVMEAMSCGIKPLVHNFVGAKTIYPEQFIWNTIGEFVEMVKSDNYDSQLYRKIIEDNYSLDQQLKSLREITRKLS